MEADFVTGPAKNLIEFGKRSRPRVALSVVAYLRGKQPETEFIKSAREAGLEVDIVHERGRFDASVSRQLRDIVDRRNPDIIQTHNSKSHFFLRKSGIWRERTWLAFHHGYTTTDLKVRLYDEVARRSLPAAQHVVTVCGPFAAQLAHRGIDPARISVQHNSVKLPPPPSEDDVQRVRKSLPAPEGTPILVSIGRLSREKGHLDLLQALPYVDEKALPYHLVIVGEGPERARLESAMSGLKLQSRVTLAGLRIDVRPYYAIADMVVLPSHSEGSPNVLLEAMIHGRPIVATNVGGVPEIVTSGETALLVPARSPEAMAGAIRRMLADADLRRRLGERARLVAESRYSPAAYCESMIYLYQRLTGVFPAS